MKILDTFAGAGGFSLGFELAGAKTIGAIEVDEWACQTFKENHPHAKVVKADITLLSDEDILRDFGSNKPDIVLGGPPCQGFSICNKKNGDPKDPRNSLFEEFIRVGRLLSPEVMIMENVPNLVKAKTENKQLVTDIIVEELKKLGYNIEYKILSASDYGVPQIRKRLFIIASKIPLKKYFPDRTHVTNDDVDLLEAHLPKCPSLWDAISDLPQVNAREGSEESSYESSPNTEYQKSIEKRLSSAV